MKILNSALSIVGVLAISFLAWTGGAAKLVPETASPVAPPRTYYAEPRLIHVTGDAEVRVAPDEVLLTIGIETQSRKLNEAKDENDARVQRVLDLADDYDIERRHIQNSYISIYPRYDSSYDKRVLVEYSVRRNLVITLKDLSKFEDLLTDLLEADVNYVHGIDFRTSELRKYRDEARARAIVAAREKAVALAAELGQEIGEPYEIREEQSNWWSGYSYWWGGSWGSSAMAQNVIQDVGGGFEGGDGDVAPGQIKVNARVAVSFALRN